MQRTLTVRLSEEESNALENICELTGKSRSHVVRDALRGFRLREALRQSQERLAPTARASGWLTEDDILQEIS